VSLDDPDSAHGGLAPESEDTASDWASSAPGPENTAPGSGFTAAPASQGSADEAPAVAATAGSPKKRGTRRHKIIYIGVAAFVVALGIGSYITAEVYSTSKSCDSCHEMNAYYNSWSVSVHRNVECVQCHIPPGFPSFVKTKVLSLRELWVHLTGSVEPPLAVTRKIPSGNCLACHANPGNVTKGTTTFPHSAHSDAKCVDCHVRLVHRTVNPPYYVDPLTMSKCLSCHNGQSGSPPSNCGACHTPPHEARGECSNCHNTNSFFRTLAAPSSHPLALTGGHQGVACSSCHVTRAGVSNIPGTSLPQPAGLSCVSCHAVQHVGLTDCANCHTVNGFLPSTFQHPREGPHVPTGEHVLTCQNCHKVTQDYQQATCSPCHSGTPSGD
jgi:nitrate/TMAO reductase-like tetraheme cytochrome c subunit